MKKLLFSLAFMAIVALMPKAVNAQVEGLKGELVLMETDSIQALPGLYEFFVPNKKDPNGSGFFMLSLNDKLYTDVIKKKGKKIVILFGPILDKVIGDRLLKDYREKRKIEENKLQAEIKDLIQVPEKEKKKEKKKRLLELEDAKDSLKKARIENEELIKQLEDILKKRSLQNTFYVYSWEVSNT